MRRRRGHRSIEAPIHLISMQRLKNGLHDLFGPNEHVAVPESQNPKSRRTQKIVSSRVVSDLSYMLTSVQLDDDRCFDASEIANIQADLMLAAEFESAELAATQASPKHALGVGLSSPQVSDASKYAAKKHFFSAEI